MKCRSRNKAWLGAAITAAAQIAGAGINYFQQQKANRKQLQQQYMSDILEMQNNIGENANNDLNNYYDRVELIPQFPYGGNTNLKPNIVRGGHAIDLGNNLYLMSGRKHSQGGIDIGKNPKTGIEVEGNEVVQTSPSGLRVFSAQPILGGISPAEYILGGANPNKVFAAQENWKRINRVSDDGRKYKNGGDKTNVAQRDSYQVNILKPGNNDIIQSNRIAHRKSLENFVKNNPELYGLKTADFVDFLLDNATMESENNPTAKHGSMYGYYQLKGLSSKSTENEQHDAAFKHLKNLFSNVLTDADVAKANELGISQAQLLHKVWNQERKVLNYLYQGKDNADGLGTKISEWGNNNSLEINYVPYLMKATYDNNINIKKGDTPEKILKSYRGAGLENRTFNNHVKDYKNLFGANPDKLKIGDVLTNSYLIGPRKPDDTFKYGGRSKKELGGNDFEPIKQREDFKPSKFKTILRKLYAGTDKSATAVNRYGDFTRMYFGVPLKDGYLYKSRYKPTKSKNPDATYYGVRDINFIHDLIELYNHPGPLEKPKTGVVNGYSTKGAKQFPWEGDYISFDLLRERDKGNKVKLGRTPHTLGPGALGRFTVGRGKDENGEYLSYYDLWDVNPKVSLKAEERGFAKPYEIYDRIYGTFDADGTFHPKGEIGESYITAEKKYGGIHIKPSKRGTFTAAASKHGMGVQAFASKVLANKDDYSPAMVKKANFAKNASKWNHKEFGGNMDFNYIIGKNNIYKLGGRRKAVNGLELYPFRIERRNLNPITTQDIHLGLPLYATNQNYDNGDYEDGIIYNKYGPRFNTVLDESVVVADRVNKTPDLASIIKENDDYIENLNLNDDINIPDETLDLDSDLTVRPMKYRKRDRGYRSKDIRAGRVEFDREEKDRVANPNRRIGSDEIGLGINLLGNLASSLINNATINSLDYGNAPLPLRAVKLKTRYNINPQLDNIREEVARGENDVTQNTASSKVALSRRQSLRGRGLQYANQLEGQRENIETELINRDRLNQQQVGNRNIERFDTWYRGLVDFENNRRNLKAENAVAGINNATDAIAGPQGYMAHKERRLENDRLLARDLLSLELLSATNPNAAPIVDDIIKNGIDSRYYKLLKKQRSI